MKTNIEKMQALGEKINQLKIDQAKIEQEIVNNLVQVLKITDAFQIDFNTLVGGLLEVISLINSSPEQKEAWRAAGQKFCKSKIETRQKKIKTHSSMEKNDV